MSRLARIIAIGGFTKEQLEELKERQAEIEKMQAACRETKARAGRAASGDKPSEDMPTERVH